MGTLPDLEGPPRAAASKRQHADDLLATPMNTDGAEVETLQRATAEYSNRCKRFLVPSRGFERQYAQLYFARLMQLGSAVSAAAQAAWPGVQPAKILDVQEDVECWVVGTFYKDMKLKPSILEEYTKDRVLKQALVAATNFCDDGDAAVLEDEGARMVLRGDALQVDHYVTGAVIAVRGRAEVGGDFQVSAVCCAGLPPQAPLPALQQPEQQDEAQEGDKYVALVSGLGLANPRVDMLKVQMLVDFLTGNLGGSSQQQLAAKVVRLIVAGGTLGQLEGLANAVPYQLKQQTVAIQPITDMDVMMTELASALPVDIMPGPDDPANVSLPQQPLHKALFPGAAPFCDFSRVTNPHEAALDGVLVLGSSGQGVDDMSKYCRGLDRLDMLEQTLQWQHMAPTAPDTLSCYPFANKDPMVVSDCPHIYFAGGQPEFATRLLEGEQGQRVRLVLVPSFAKTGMAVLVNLRTLQCQTVCFEGQYARKD